MRKRLSIVLSFIFTFFTLSCQNDSTVGTSHLRITLIDQPGEYESVNVDILEVRVHTSATVSDDDPGENGDENNDSDPGGWVTLEGSDLGQVNLFDYINGQELTIYDSEFPSGYISQIRLVLGERNTIVIDGDSIKLKTPSGKQSGVKLNIHQNLEAGLSYHFKFDFEASQSIVHTGNDDYLLKPVIRVISENIGGSIKGEVLPAGALVRVTVLDGDEEIGGTDAPQGISEFLIPGIDPGTYSVSLDPGEESLLDGKLVEDVVVEKGRITDIGIHDLEKE